MELRLFIPISQSIYLYLCILLCGCTCIHPVQANTDWNVRHSDRQTDIIRRLLRMYLREPQPGYALQKLLRYFSSPNQHNRLLLHIQLASKGLPSHRIHRASGWIRLHMRQPHRVLRQILPLLRSKVQQPRKIRRELYRLVAKAYTQLHIYDKAYIYRTQQFHSTSSHSKRRRLIHSIMKLTARQRRWTTVERWYQLYIRQYRRHRKIEYIGLRASLRLKQWPRAQRRIHFLLRHTPTHQHLTLHFKWLLCAHKQKHDRALILRVSWLQKRLSSKHWAHHRLMRLKLNAYRRQRKLNLLLQNFERTHAFLGIYRLFWKATALRLTQSPSEAIQLYSRFFQKMPHAVQLHTTVHWALRHRAFQAALQWLRWSLHTGRYPLITVRLYLQSLHQARLYTERDRWIRRAWKPTHRMYRWRHSIERITRTWSHAYSIRNWLYTRLCSSGHLTIQCIVRWGRLHWKHKQHKQAWMIWKRLRLQDPQKKHAHLHYAQLCFKYRRFTCSLRTLQSLRTYHPNDSQISFWLARNYAVRKKWTLAFQMYRQCLNQKILSKEQQQNIRAEYVRQLRRVYGRSMAVQRLTQQALLHPFSKEQTRQLLTHYAMEWKHYVHTWRIQHKKAPSKDRVRVSQAILPAWLTGRLLWYRKKQPLELDFARWVLLFYSRTAHARQALQHLVRHTPKTIGLYVNELKWQLRQASPNALLWLRWKSYCTNQRLNVWSSIPKAPRSLALWKLCRSVLKASFVQSKRLEERRRMHRPRHKRNPNKASMGTAPR